MSDHQTTPLTPLLKRLRSLPASRVGRLHLAEALARDSSPLIAEMLDSVRLLQPFDRSGTPFCGPRPVLARDLDAVAYRERSVRTADFAHWLGCRRHLAVALDPQLDCEFVEHELAPTGAGRRARMSDHNRSAALRIDLLLANADRDDRTPVVAEVKIGRDTDPFAGLVQALAGLVHLATASQYQRLRGAYPQAEFPDRDPPPPLDAYVLCVDTAWEVPLMVELLLAARQIAHNLSQARETATIMRRAVLLELSRGPGRLWSEAVRL